jgi:hypothetical protein
MIMLPSFSGGRLWRSYHHPSQRISPPACFCWVPPRKRGLLCVFFSVHPEWIMCQWCHETREKETGKINCTCTFYHFSIPGKSLCKLPIYLITFFSPPYTYNNNNILLIYFFGAPCCTLFNSRRPVSSPFLQNKEEIVSKMEWRGTLTIPKG